jgi:hypothetical protein
MMLGWCDRASTLWFITTGNRLLVEFKHLYPENQLSVWNCLNIKVENMEKCLKRFVSKLTVYLHVIILSLILRLPFIIYIRQYSELLTLPNIFNPVFSRTKKCALINLLHQILKKCLNFIRKYVRSNNGLI